MQNVKRQTCKNDRCATETDGQVRGERQGAVWSLSLGPGTQLQQYVCHSCQLNIYNDVRPGDPSSGDSSTWAPSQVSFPIDMGWGTPSPPTRWSSTGRGIRGHGGGGSIRERLWTLLSFFTSLAWRAALSFGAPAPDPNWTNASTGSQGLGCTGKTGSG